MTFNFINSYKEDIKNKDKIDYIELVSFHDFYSYILPSKSNEREVNSHFDLIQKQVSLDIPRCQIYVNHTKINSLEHFFDMISNIQPSFLYQMIPFACQSIMAYPYELYYKNYNSTMIADSGAHLCIHFHVTDRKWVFFARKKMTSIFIKDLDDYIHVNDSLMEKKYVYMNLMYDSVSPMVIVYLYDDSDILVNDSYQKMLERLRISIRESIPNGNIL